MTKAVFIAKPDSAYDDQPGKYHFPRTYLRQVEAAKGSSGGRQEYFATARLNSIQPDPVVTDHYLCFC